MAKVVYDRSYVRPTRYLHTMYKGRRNLRIGGLLLWFVFDLSNLLDR